MTDNNFYYKEKKYLHLRRCVFYFLIKESDLKKEPLKDLSELKAPPSKDGMYDIFLSHSYMDRGLASSLLKRLQKKGISIYIDWLVDPCENPENITRRQANLIRHRIKNSRSLVFLQTANTVVSRWVPWELGLSDGIHGKVAKIKTKEAQSRKNEYLKLYPTLRYDNKGGYYVFEHNKILTDLETWIRQLHS